MQLTNDSKFQNSNDSKRGKRFHHINKKYMNITHRDLKIYNLEKFKQWICMQHIKMKFEKEKKNAHID